jgi:hypothetical protein
MGEELSSCFPFLCIYIFMDAMANTRWGQEGPHLGSILDPFGRLGDHFKQFVPSLAPSWILFGPFLDPCWAHDGPIEVV